MVHSVKSLVKQFKEFYYNETFEALDFRSSVYAFNSYALHPQGNVSEIDVDLLYKWANSFNLITFHYNTQMSLDQLRISTYKSLVHEVCEILASEGE